LGEVGNSRIATLVLAVNAAEISSIIGPNAVSHAATRSVVSALAVVASASGAKANDA
jgi:ABC-type cobalamin transport system ATPase subunit